MTDVFKALRDGQPLAAFTDDDLRTLAAHPLMTSDELRQVAHEASRRTDAAMTDLRTAGGFQTPQDWVVADRALATCERMHDVQLRFIRRWGQARRRARRQDRRHRRLMD